MKLFLPVMQVFQSIPHVLVIKICSTVLIMLWFICEQENSTDIALCSMRLKLIILKKKYVNLVLSIKLAPFSQYLYSNCMLWVIADNYFNNEVYMINE